MNNYHWYLKQEINSSADDEIIAIQWDTEISLRLYLVTKCNAVNLKVMLTCIVLLILFLHLS